jgi:hypothetical protein
MPDIKPVYLPHDEPYRKRVAKAACTWPRDVGMIDVS